MIEFFKLFLTYKFIKCIIGFILAIIAIIFFYKIGMLNELYIFFKKFKVVNNM